MPNPLLIQMINRIVAILLLIASPALAIEMRTYAVDTTKPVNLVTIVTKGQKASPQPALNTALEPIVGSTMCMQFLIAYDPTTQLTIDPLVLSGALTLTHIDIIFDTLDPRDGSLTTKIIPKFNAANPKACYVVGISS